MSVLLTFTPFVIGIRNRPWFGSAPRVDKIQQTEFAGRILMSISANITEMPQRIEKAIRPIQPPQSCEYVLHVDLYETSTLTGVGGFFSWQNVKIEVCFGHVKMMTNTAKEKYEDPKTKQKLLGYTFTCPEMYAADKDGTDSKYCRFHQINMQLPRVTAKDSQRKWQQLFDLVLNVYDGEDNRIGLCRFDARTLIEKTDADMSSKPEWHPIRGLEQDGAVRTRGFVLFHAALKAIKKSDPIPPRPPLAEIEENAEFQIRAHVYMARELKPESGNALVSPFVRVSLGGRHLKLLVPHYFDEGEDGQKKWFECKQEELKNASALREHRTIEQTSTVKESRNPIWMQTLHSKVKLNKVSGDSDMSLSMAPDIVVTVYDEGHEGEDYIGRATYPPVLCSKDRWPRKGADGIKREPIWLDLQREDLNYNRASTYADREEESVSGAAGQGKVISHGKILILFEVIDEDNFVEDEESFDGDHSWPPLTTAKIQLVSLGLRNLRLPGGYPATNPQFQLIVPNFPDRVKEKNDRQAKLDSSDGEDDSDDNTSEDEGPGSTDDEDDVRKHKSIIYFLYKLTQLIQIF